MMRGIESIEHPKRSKTARAASEHQMARRASAHQPTIEEQLLRELLAEAHARIRALEKALDRLKTAI